MKPNKILFVDDLETVRRSISLLLSIPGYDVMTAASGEDGVQKFREHQSEIGLVLLDMSMPGLSGPETLLEMRKIDEETPIYLMSGYSDPDDAELENLNLTGFVSKPYSKDELLRLIESELGAPTARD